MLSPACMKKNILLSISSESTLVKTSCTVAYSGVAGLISWGGGGMLEEE